MKTEQETPPVRVTIVGLGGIGSALVESVARRLAYHRGPDGAPVRAVLTLVDGDAYEDGNAVRQSFEGLGNKAKCAAARLQKLHLPNTLDIVAIDAFLSPEIAPFVLVDGEIVLLCVDNHQTRKFVCEYWRGAGVSDLTVISGGNDTKGQGDVFVYVVRDGRDVTPSLIAMDPAIAHPTEKAPWEKSCEELARAGEPQLLAANRTAAVIMENALHALLEDPTGFVARASSTEFDHGGIVAGYTHVLFDIYANCTVSRRVLIERAEHAAVQATAA